MFIYVFYLGCLLNLIIGRTGKFPYKTRAYWSIISEQPWVEGLRKRPQNYVVRSVRPPPASLEFDHCERPASFLR